MKKLTSTLKYKSSDVQYIYLPDLNNDSVSTEYYNLKKVTVHEVANSKAQGNMANIS